MAGTATHTPFIDSGFARLCALCLAIAIAVLLYTRWGEDMAALMAAGSTAPQPAQSNTVKPANPALEACLANRVGDVDRMKDEGIVDDRQYSKFKARAEELCRAQHPG